jgi:hypothetical protein
MGFRKQRRETPAKFGIKRPWIRGASVPAKILGANWLHTEGVEFMKKLAGVCIQDFICPERAMLDPDGNVPAGKRLRVLVARA